MELDFLLVYLDIINNGGTYVYNKKLIITWKFQWGHTGGHSLKLGGGIVTSLCLSFIFKKGCSSILHHINSSTALLSSVLKNVKGNVWIGLSRFGDYGEYYWSDGGTLRYTNWALGEPDGPLQPEDSEGKVNVWK